MAWSKVQGAQSAGGVNATSVAISAATAGNTLVSFFSQTGTNTPTCTGFTVEAVKAVYNTGASSVWVATKIAAGGETSVAWTPGSGGTGHGVAAFELAGGPATVTKDGAVVNVDNNPVSTSLNISITTAATGSIILFGIGADASSGTINVWTGATPATNIGTAAARCYGAHFIAGAPATDSDTANWSTGHVAGGLAIALNISAGGATQTLDASLTPTPTISADLTLQNVVLAAALAPVPTISADLVRAIALAVGISTSPTIAAALVTQLSLAAVLTPAPTIAADLFVTSGGGGGTTNERMKMGVGT